MTGVLVSDITATAVLVTVLVGLVGALLGGLVIRGWRSGRGSEDRMASLVRDLDSRMEDLGRELAEALERARDETRRGRLAGEIAGTIDLDSVMRKTLDAAAAVPGTDAALITLESPEGEPVTASVGLSPEEVDEHSLGSAPSGVRIRSMVVEYEPRLGLLPGAAPPIAVGLAVPIRTTVDRLGLLSVFSRGGRGVFSESQLRELEDVAGRAAPALANARRFKEARQLADLDGLTSLHNRRYFNETLAREVARAQRYGRRLAILLLDLDNLKTINDQLGHLAGDAALGEVAQRVRAVVRTADIACRTGGDEFAVILPESGIEDADQLYRRLFETIAARPVVNGVRLALSGGVAELRPNEDPTGLYQRADEALYRAKQAGKGRLSD